MLKKSADVTMPKNFSRVNVESWQQVVDTFMEVELAPPSMRQAARRRIESIYGVERVGPSARRSVGSSIPAVLAENLDPQGPLLARPNVARYCKTALKSVKPAPATLFRALQRKVRVEVRNLAPTIQEEPATG